MTPQGAGRRFRPASPATALVLGVRAGHFAVPGRSAAVTAAAVDDVGLRHRSHGVGRQRRGSGGRLDARRGALFNPLRRRVQRAVDRRFNRACCVAVQMVAAFAARLNEAVNLDSVQADLVRVVHQALELVHVSVWVGHHDQTRRSGS